MNQMNVSDTVMYSKDHEWISVDAPHRIGISDFAQEKLGDLTFAELSPVGTHLKKGEEFGTLESTKAASSLYSPADCTVVAVNSTLEGDPGLVNTDPYGNGWLMEVTLDDTLQLESLMDARAYAAFLASEGH